VAQRKRETSSLALNASIDEGDASNNRTTVCRHYGEHQFGDTKAHAERDQPSLLWTFVRHPQARDVSFFFHFGVARHNVKPDSFTAFKEFALKNRGRQTKYLKPSSKGGNQMLDPKNLRHNEQKAGRFISRLLEHYDFIGLTERMPESLAVMTLLWDLDPTDVIVFAAKQSGSYDTAGWGGKCVMMQKALLTEENRNLLLSPEYLTGNVDFLLYAAAEASLDRTTQALGADTVQKRTTLIRQLQLLAEERCRSKVVFPCSETGVYQNELALSNCYHSDVGCGYSCVDQVMKEYRENEVTLPQL
jgi:hypothetical protein